MYSLLTGINRSRPPTSHHPLGPLQVGPCFKPPLPVLSYFSSPCPFLPFSARQGRAYRDAINLLASSFPTFVFLSQASSCASIPISVSIPLGRHFQFPSICDF